MMEKKQNQTESGLRLLVSDLRGLLPVAAGVLLYGAVTHVVFGRFCPMLILTGFPCPGCGMTRAFFLALRGRAGEAWALQPPVYGWLLLGLAFAVRRYLIRKPVSAREHRLWTAALTLLLLASLVLYGYRLLHGFPPGLVQPAGGVLRFV